MKTLITLGMALLSLLIAPLASAQVYYPASGAAVCVSIPAGLSVGSRGGDVTNLQNFLVAQHYPGGGSWMVTGYFGQATAAALRNFQQLQNLPQTGMTDTMTVSALSRVSCGAPTVNPTVLYPNTTPTPLPVYPSTTYPLYNSYFNNNYFGNAPVITSLSQNTGFTGNVITINGVGFDQWNNTVNFGGTPVYNVPSSNGTSLTVTVPANYYSYSFAGTQVQVTVQNSHGTSNAVSFMIVGSSNGCGPYFSTSCGGCSYPYNTYNSTNTLYCPPQNTTTPIVSYITPTSGGVGETVNVYGSGFSTTGNAVHFGPGIIANLPSFDGHGISFTVPYSLSGYGNQPLTLSTYQISVSNALGYTSNTVPFTVTSLATPNGAPVIASVAGPTTLAVGTQGLWTVVVNTMNNQSLTLSVNWGDQNVYGAQAASQQVYGGGQQTNTLTHTYANPGTYTIQFTASNNAGLQNTYTTTVVVSSGVYNPNPQTASVAIANMAFSPFALTVRAGTTITWVNNDALAHTVTGDSGLFGSGTLAAGQSFRFTFNTPGTYTYHCAIHPSMTGTVVVTQ